MMARTQFTLDPETHKRARTRASVLGISLAEYFRRLVQKDLGIDLKKKVDVSCIFDLGSGGRSNIAVDKDQMIADAFEADLQRSRQR